MPQTAVQSETDKGRKPPPDRLEWIGNLVVLAMVLAPAAIAFVILAVGFTAIAGWQTLHGTSAKLPTAASARLYRMWAYTTACWIAVGAVWLWSSHRGMRAEVFAIKRMPWPALIMSIGAFIIAMYGVPAFTHWLSYLTGGRSEDVRIDFHDAQSVLTYLFLFVITAPVCEEILYRDLLVAWLDRRGWNNFAILLAGSLLFGANHYLLLGSFVWSGAMVGF